MTVDGSLIQVRAFRRGEDCYDVISGRKPESSGEIIITESAARSLGRNTGDTVTVKIP